MRGWYLRNRERLLRVAKDRYAGEYKAPDRVKTYQTREERKAYMRRWYEANPDKDVRKAGVRLSARAYNSMLTQQGGRCAICGDLPGRTRLAIDHDHSTIQARALLCGRCNTGLGQFRDDPALLRMAAIYLESHRMRVAKRA